MPDEDIDEIRAGCDDGCRQRRSFTEDGTATLASSDSGHLLMEVVELVAAVDDGAMMFGLVAANSVHRRITRH